jgi:hypothetical protein
MDMGVAVNHCINWFDSNVRSQELGSNAAGLVLRLALKTRFSVMGMGFDSSATRQVTTVERQWLANKLADKIA